MDAKLLSYIFLDAHVLDLDFSEWDRAVRLLVVATELPPDSKRRLPLFLVSFQEVGEFAVKFSHLDKPLSEGHYQWRADTFKLAASGARKRVEIAGRRQFPQIVLECQDIDVRPIDTDGLTRALPHWARPGGPLVRPGIEALIAAARHSKGPGSNQARAGTGADEAISDDELERIERLCEAATPGPWRSFVEGRDHESGSDFVQTAGEDIELSGASRADRDFIASARQDVPRLLSEIRWLRSVLAGRAGRPKKRRSR